MDLKKLSSRIICSANITRQSLNQQPIVSSTPDDDDQFFQKIKSEIDKNLLCFKENYKPNNYQYTSLKRKRSIINEETQNIIKRFKKDRDHRNHSVETLRDISIQQSNYVHNNVKETANIITNISAKNIIQQTNMFSPNILTTNLRNPSNNCVLQMASKLQKNILPLTTNETTLLQEEYEESLFYTMFLTPPDSNFVEDNEGSESCSTLNTIL